MRHQIPGLHSRHQDSETSCDGVFLVRVERAWYRRHPQKPFVELRFVILEPQPFQDRSFSVGCIAPKEPYGSSIGFFETSATMPTCSTAIKWMKRPF